MALNTIGQPSSRLLEAGARTDLLGNDGKLPLDIAIEVFDRSDPIVQRLEHKEADP
jgi:hypothetical protein